MKVSFAGKSIRLHAEHPQDDAMLQEMVLPRGLSLMPDDKLAVELTRAEAWQVLCNCPALEVTQPIAALFVSEYP